jgi:signal transduction histidine kinase/ActR/RegA family two-component response regulator
MTSETGLTTPPILNGKASHPQSQQKTLRWMGGVALLAVVYLAAAKLGLSLAFLVEQISPVWPPSGIALAAILLFGFRVWPGIVLGAFIANATANEPLLTAAGIAMGNTLEAVTGAWLLKRVAKFENSLERVRDVLGLIVLAALMSTMLSATIGVVTLCLSHQYLPQLERTIQWSDFASLWSVWWVGDAMGILVVTPPLLTAASSGRDLFERLWESSALFVALVATCSLIFVNDLTTDLGQVSLAYLVFPYVIWSALRLGPCGTSLVTLTASSLMIWATLHNYGPFGTGPIHERLVVLQIFVGVVAISALLLSAALAERKQVVEALRDADRRKDEFIAILAHELRNPLSPIRTGVDLMRMIEDKEPQFDEVLMLLDRQVQQLTRLVDDLLDVSRAVRGKILLQLQIVNLATIIDRAVETSRPLMDGRGHHLTVSLPSEGVFLEADGGRLAQVFANLLNNAAKYTDPGGRISVTASTQPGFVVVRVSDTGCGIDGTVLPHVFDLFTQADRSISHSQGGLGIGLTLVRRLVELHGGMVRATSEGAGNGSEFEVTLPTTSVSRSAIEKRKPSSTVGAAAMLYRILVVDDNLDAARSLELLLNAAGHEVFTSDAGPDVLGVITALQPEILILDIGLPKIDGYKVARSMRNESRYKDIILVALTGWGRPGEQQRAIDAGFDHYLTKPVDYLTLETIIATAGKAKTREPLMTEFKK